MCDDMRVWRWKGSCRKWLNNGEKGCIETIGKALKTVPDIPWYCIWMRYYENKSSQDLSKMVVAMEGKQLAVVNKCMQLWYGYIYSFIIIVAIMQ